jgi:hypothetical protein
MNHAKPAKLFVTVLCGCLLSAYGSDPKPDFTGDWTLDIAKSDFGPLEAPAKATAKVRHQDPDLKIDLRQDDVTAALVCATDGSEQKQCAGPILGIPYPVIVTSKVTWEGRSLIFVSVGEYEGGHVDVRDQWELSQDGKTAIIHRSATSPSGEASQLIVLEKAP